MIYDDMEHPVIKYDYIYTPNPLISEKIKPHTTFNDYSEMMRVCGAFLKEEAEKAEDNDTNFTPYTVRDILKPEFRPPGWTEEDNE
jgi:hypothetical protein